MNEVSPLTHGLNYRSACDRSYLTNFKDAGNKPSENDIFAILAMTIYTENVSIGF